VSESPSTSRRRAPNTFRLIAQIHAEEAAGLFERRTAFIHAPDAHLSALDRLDRRLAAHLDGVAISAGPLNSLGDASSSPNAGDIFATAVGMIESGEPLPDWLWAKSADSSIRPVIAAFEWTDRQYLQGIVRALLNSREPVRRLVGIATCAAHRADPGLQNGDWLRDPSSPVRAAALRAVGELGLTDLAPLTADWLGEEDTDCRFWATWSAVLLGAHETALSTLKVTGLNPGPNRARAFRLSLQAMSQDRAHEYLADLAHDESQLRWVIQGSGIAGDPSYIPWLIRHIKDAQYARVAGESLALLTALDINKSGAWLPRPENFESGPNDDPDDPNVEMDPDDGLPWPDPQKVEAWWQANEHRFHKGTRYFMGQPVTKEHCIQVLKTGYQRQRILAAQYLCLLEPGTPLFNTSAPAWRQQRLLAAM
jgi:uncharacterized protein (TIGR02270 family)